MNRVLVYAPNGATRKLYQKTLFSREREIILVKDGVEFFLSLLTFDIDTLILIDEGHLHEMQLMLEVIAKKYNQKRVIVISWEIRVPKGLERYSTTRAFFEKLAKEGERLNTDDV